MLRTLMVAVLALAACAPRQKGGDKPAVATEKDHAVRPRAEVAKEPAYETYSAARAARAERVLLRGGTVLTAAGEAIEHGDVLLAGGRIEKVSKEPLAVPDVTVVDVSGKFITPGIIDTHSHLGVYAVPGTQAADDGNEATSPVTAHVRALDSFWPQDPSIYRAVMGGVTSMQVLPGSANLIGGEGVVMKLGPGLNPHQMRFPGAPRTLKMACGENPKRVYGEKGRQPSTRMGSLAEERATFEDVLAYRERARKYEEAYAEYAKKQADEGDQKPPDAPERRFGMETLSALLDGKVLLQTHCYRADDMLSVLHLADTYGFKVRSFHHALEAYKIRDELAKRDIASSTWADWWGFKMEAYDGIPQNAGLLTRAGARTVIHSDSHIGIQRLNQEAGKALGEARRAGLLVSDDEALRWVTANPAWVLGVEQQTGTLEAGKMADVVVWSAHPFSIYALAERVYGDGVLLYERGKTPPYSDFESGLGGGR